ncbi:ESX-1 secretion-associated protein EspA [Mycobacterium pseudokansasii]|uniref:ESX-1 secretion-associated protein EspA n=1 Tax=Mycobacterium pseudokansasii TaxID=2341080 RepID=A0A498QZN3_9MYCO|nr:ESX-1 secretion-associated protein EspA [Mycobacterium pseudokansasii]
MAEDPEPSENQVDYTFSEDEPNVGPKGEFEQFEVEDGAENSENSTHDPLQGGKGRWPGGWIIQGTVAVLTGLALLDGFGDEKGRKFAVGGERFEHIAQELAKAVPGQGWQGVASQAYAARIGDVRRVVEQMAQADKGMAQLVDRHGRQVDITREVLATFAAFLGLVCLRIALLLEEAGQFKASLIFQLSVCSPALAAGGTAQSVLMEHSRMTAAKIHGAIGGYRRVESVQAGSGVGGVGQVGSVGAGARQWVVDADGGPHLQGPGAVSGTAPLVGDDAAVPVSLVDPAGGEGTHRPAGVFAQRGSVRADAPTPHPPLSPWPGTAPTPHLTASPPSAPAATPAATPAAAEGSPPDPVGAGVQAYPGATAGSARPQAVGGSHRGGRRGAGDPRLAPPPVGSPIKRSDSPDHDAYQEQQSGAASATAAAPRVPLTATAATPPDDTPHPG